MWQNILQVIIALAALFNLNLAYYEVQPQYQVSIMWEFPKGHPIHLCNGVIVSDKLVLTTANCLHFKFASQGDPSKLDASVLSVLAGSGNELREAFRVNVSDLSVAENFNPRTLENDLALLTLNQSLPLGTRNDMKWIMLDDNKYVNHSCLANFFSRNSKDAIPNYYQTEELSLRNNGICRNFTEHPNSRKDDICSIYVLPRQFDCAAADSFLSFNNDRGTGLICRSNLVGLLSSVVTRPTPKNNCADIELSALYTSIYPHLMWIYEAMTNVEAEDISAPYDASVNLLMVNSTNADDKKMSNSTKISPANETQSNFINSVNIRESSLNQFNLTSSNSTKVNSTSTNSTIERPKPVQPTRTYAIVERSPTTIPPPTSSSDSYRSKNSAALSSSSSGVFSIVTAFISLRLIIFQ